MAIPLAGPKMRETLQIYRDAYRKAGHPGNGEVMLAFQMFADTDGDRARRIAKPKVEAYLHSLVEASSDWAEGTSSADYPGYDKMVEKLRTETMESQIESGSAWIGTPEEIRASIARVQDAFGGFEHASMQINFNTMPQDEAMRSLELFAREVIPKC